MLGNDCEKILTNINTIISAANTMTSMVINSMAGPISTTLHYGGSFPYGSDGGTLNIDIDAQSTENAGASVGSVYILTDATSALKSSASTMAALGSDLYSDTTSFNNSIGSPWTEMSVLSSACSNIEYYVSTNGDLEYTSQKIGLLSLLNSLITLAVDAKWAIITYHDYIQRGYDCVYNDNVPSITTKRTINEYTTGNLKQTISNNVNIAEESIDPF